MTTSAQIARVTRDYSQIAGEPIQIEVFGGTLYAFCSELGALRLFHKMSSKGRVGFSQNLESWYFSLDLHYSVAA